MRKKCLGWRKTALLLNITLSFYTIFSLVIISWFYHITDFEKIFNYEEDYVFKHSCIAVIVIDICLFLWSIFGIMTSFRKRNKSTTIYAVFLFVLLFYKALYGSIFLSGGSEVGYNFQTLMAKKWENCCDEKQSYYDIVIWKISSMNELVSVITMFFIGNTASLCLYKVSIS